MVGGLLCEPEHYMSLSYIPPATPALPQGHQPMVVDRTPTIGFTPCQDLLMSDGTPLVGRRHEKRHEAKGVNKFVRHGKTLSLKQLNSVLREPLTTELNFLRQKNSLFITMRSP